jgi:hypothetical protein
MYIKRTYSGQQSGRRRGCDYIRENPSERCEDNGWDRHGQSKSAYDACPGTCFAYNGDRHDGGGGGGGRGRDGGSK